MSALIKDSEHLAAMVDNVPSIDNLDFIMESDALGHTVMDQKQGHESLLAVAETVTLEDVNSAGAKVLEFIADFGKTIAPLPAAIVACVPKTVHIDGTEDVEFKILPEEIISSINGGLNQHIEPEPDLEVPTELISASQLESLWLRQKPSFVPVDQDGTAMKLVDKDTGIVQRRLSNGIHINYKASQNEAKGGVMRLVVGGGRAKETPDTQGAVIVGVRTLSESGRVEGFSREQVELFCVNHLINCALESTEEFICMDFHFNLRDGGMRAAFQLLHMVIEHNVWLEDAFDRATQLYVSHYHAMPKSLERATAHRLMRAMLKGDERFVEPSPQTIQCLTLPVVKDAVVKQFVTDNMEVSIVGDFTEEDIESCILDYLGTIRATKGDYKEADEVPVTFQASHMDLQNQQVFLKDSDERACAYIAGPSPNRWGFTIDDQNLNNIIEPVSLTEEQAQSLASNGVKVKKDADGKLFWKRQKHPLYCCVTLTLLAEIINSRLFTTVRDSLGLTYDVSFELSLFDRLQFGWFVISVTSTPAKVHKAVDACKNVLRGLHSSRITQNELDRAKRTLLMRHESDIKSNPYWLGLLTHLQSPSVPKKDISCIRDLVSYYEGTTIDDVYNTYSYLKVDDDSLFTCIGISGSQVGEDVAGIEIAEVDGDEGLQDLIPRGRRSTTVTRPTT
uniref:Peptidase M16 C-terminal domain-containing protein n=1 Tax=Araucaria cunninghamii TaxID=56994 RepID=A0A0D6QV97_ARACU